MANKGITAMAKVGRMLLMRAQNNRCIVCGKRLPKAKLHDAHPEGTTVDHVWPISRFGNANSPGNHALSHKKCNGTKSDRDPRGCELLFLFAVNRRLGYSEAETKRWDTPPLLLDRPIVVRKRS